MNNIYFKVLGLNGTCCHGGSGRWLINGDWMPIVYGTMTPCVRGYHLCRALDLLEWLGPVIWIAEGKGEHALISSQHLIFPEARVIRRLDSWTPQVARLFAVECAERVFSCLATHFPDEPRPKQTLEAVREEMQKESFQFARLTKIAQAAWSASRCFEGALREVAIATYSTAAWENGGMAAWASAGAARSAMSANALEFAMADAKKNQLPPRDAEKMANSAASIALKAEREWQTTRLFELLGNIDIH